MMSKVEMLQRQLTAKFSCINIQLGWGVACRVRE